jgi:hypothetical protein
MKKNIRLILALLLAVLMLNLAGARPTAANAPEQAPNQSALPVVSRPVATPCPAGSERPYPPCYFWP